MEAHTPDERLPNEAYSLSAGYDDDRDERATFRTAGQQPWTDDGIPPDPEIARTAEMIRTLGDEIESLQRDLAWHERERVALEARLREAIGLAHQHALENRALRREADVLKAELAACQHDNVHVIRPEVPF